MRPRGLVVNPFSVVGVERIDAGMVLDQPANLLLREVKGAADLLTKILREIIPRITQSRGSLVPCLCLGEG
jgi:hypothetical protein